LLACAEIFPFDRIDTSHASLPVSLFRRRRLQPVIR